LPGPNDNDKMINDKMINDKAKMTSLWRFAIRSHSHFPIEIPKKAKGKKWENIPIRANPSKSIATLDTRIQIQQLSLIHHIYYG
jgi:hypothetical protein